MNLILPVLLVSLVSSALTLAQGAAEKPKSEPSSQKAKPPKLKPDVYEKNVPRPTHSEVRYGPHARNVVDFWKAGSDKPTPLVLVIHGGGWSGGSKERVSRFVEVKSLLDAGISVAAINYRFIAQAREQGVTPPVKVPLHDAARALQFIRSKATEWNIDPKHIGAAGGSAGACSSLWLAYHDDLADAKSEDPISRQSTRLACIAVMGAQTTLDPRQAKEWTPNSSYGGHAFAKENFAQALADRETFLPWIAEYSPYSLASKDDPPVALFYSTPPATGKEEKDPTHSANYGIGLQQRCKELGIQCDVIYPGAVEATYESPTDYLTKALMTK